MSIKRAKELIEQKRNRIKYLEEELEISVLQGYFCGVPLKDFTKDELITIVEIAWDYNKVEPHGLGNLLWD